MRSNKLHGVIIVTYRCNARCNMCDVWHYPTKANEEIGLDVLAKLPDLYYLNITGGEPFIRQDLPEIVRLMRKKAKRIVISTNGYFTDRIVALCREFPEVGIRISIEGLPKTNDDIRQIPDGFDRGLRTLLELRSMGLKDIGFGMTVQDLNAKDLVPLYHLGQALDYEFATATLHNSHYFHKLDNVIKDKAAVNGEFKKLIRELLRSKKPKEWFRAYFNLGLMNYIEGRPRMLACEMGRDGFFVDPAGDVLPCNGMTEKQSMGNLHERTWEQIWNSDRAQEVRAMVKSCGKNCWMMGSAAPAILSHPVKPLTWVFKNKLRLVLGKDVCFHE
jgi:Fe-coproporphyrin III synthase